MSEIEIRCAYCFDITGTPVYGGRKEGESKPFCDPDCLDLYKRLNEDRPKMQRVRLSECGVWVARRHQGTAPAQQERLEEIDSENNNPDPDAKGPKLRKNKGSLYRREG